MASDKDVLLKLLMDKPVAYHVDLAKAVGSVTAGLFLSQMLYWSGKGNDPDGWIYKTQAELYNETGLGRYEQETARKVLKKVKVINEERRGIPAKLYYKIDFDELVKVLKNYYDNNTPNPNNPKKSNNPKNLNNPGTPVNSRMVDSNILECDNTTNKNGGFQHTGLVDCSIHTITENTSETTNNVVVVKDSTPEKINAEEKNLTEKFKSLKKELNPTAYQIQEIIVGIKEVTGTAIEQKDAVLVLSQFPFDYVKEKITEVMPGSNIDQNLTGWLLAACWGDWKKVKPEKPVKSQNNNRTRKPQPKSSNIPSPQNSKKMELIKSLYMS